MIVCAVSIRACPSSGAAAGGWKDTSSLKRAYEQADPETILKVVLNPGSLREVQK
jgi:hypothetical protein